MASIIVATTVAASVGRAARIIFDVEVGAITAAVAFFGSLASIAMIAIRQLNRTTDEDPRKTTTINTEGSLLHRVEALTEQLATTAHLFDELQAELNARVAAIESLRDKAEHYERLASLNRDHAETVQKLVEITISHANTETRNRNWRQQLGFWLAAVAISFPVGILVNLLHNKLFQN